MGKGKKSNHHSDDSETILKSKKKIQKEKTSEKKVLKSKKKIQKEKSSEKKILKSKKEKSSEKKTMKKLSKCENLKKVEESLLINREKEEETPEKKIECCFSVPEANGYNWGNNWRTIYVKGFDSSLARDAIKTALTNHFSQCGQVIRVFVPIECETGVRLGFAFINLKNKDDIEKALALNGSDLGGRKLEVMKAYDRDDFYSYPYPNSKGCDACSVRDHRNRIYNFNSLTDGGRLMSLGYLHRLKERTWPDIYESRYKMRKN